MDKTEKFHDVLKYGAPRNVWSPTFDGVTRQGWRKFDLSNVKVGDSLKYRIGSDTYEVKVAETRFDLKSKRITIKKGMPGLYEMTFSKRRDGEWRPMVGEHHTYSSARIEKWLPGEQQQTNLDRGF